MNKLGASSTFPATRSQYESIDHTGNDSVMKIGEMRSDFSNQVGQSIHYYKHLSEGIVYQ
jgi:hypothetical protein